MIWQESNRCTHASILSSLFLRTIRGRLTLGIANPCDNAELEELIEHRTLALRESERRFRMVAALSPVGIAFGREVWIQQTVNVVAELRHKSVGRSRVCERQMARVYWP